MQLYFQQKNFAAGRKSLLANSMITKFLPGFLPCASEFPCFWHIYLISATFYRPDETPILGGFGYIKQKSAEIKL